LALFFLELDSVGALSSKTTGKTKNYIQKELRIIFYFTPHIQKDQENSFSLPYQIDHEWLKVVVFFHLLRSGIPEV
jgi:hypothetical protein